LSSEGGNPIRILLGQVSGDETDDEDKQRRRRRRRGGGARGRD